MPLYTHKCNKCGKVTEIQRSFDEYQDVPTQDEQACDCKDTTWTKELGTFRVTKAPGFGSKGYWAILVGVGICQPFLDILL